MIVYTVLLKSKIFTYKKLYLPYSFPYLKLALERSLALISPVQLQPPV